MKSLCITGSVQSCLNEFAALLGQAGAAAALPAARDQAMTMAVWHKKVLAMQSMRDDDLAPAPVLGRAWEQMAGDIFLANHTQPLWYWADTGSSQLLDFWLEFDPNTYFLLVHSAPEMALLHAIEQGAESLDELNASLDAWYTRTQLMLRFSLRHPERCQLIGSQAVISQPQPYLQHLVQRWQLPLDYKQVSSSHQPDILPVAHYLIAQLLDEHPQVLALHEEVQASLFSVEEARQRRPAPALDLVVQSYLANQRKLLAANQQRDALLDELERRLAASELAGQESREQVACLQDENQQLQGKLAEQQRQLAAAGASLESSEDESQSLLLQLHQTQEEFEQQILKEQRTQQQLQHLNAQVADQQQRIASLEKAIDQEKAAHANSRQTAQQEKSALQTRLDAFEREQAQQRAAFASQLEESESENDMLLLHLHETQEELEQYLLQHQASQAEVAQLRTRLNKLLVRVPDYWDADSIDVTPLDAPAGSQLVQWRLTNLDLGDRLVPELSFKTTFSNGLAGIIIQRSEGSESPAPLLRWPAAFAAKQELPCIPVRGPATEGNNAALTGLGTSDWQLLQRLIRCLLALLNSPDEKRLPSQLDREGLCQGLLALQHSLMNWPTVLRYDTIEMRQIQQTDTYHSLELRLENLQLGQQQWPALDYRLATVDTEPGDFGQNPRLEFPVSTREALQSWFAESDDERGARLELRFARPDAMDTRVWNGLAGNDRLLIAALLVSLAGQIEHLRAAAPSAQPWQAWQTLAESMRTILARNAMATGQTQGA